LRENEKLRIDIGQKANSNDVIELTNQLNNEIPKLQSKINSNIQNMNYLEKAMEQNAQVLEEIKQNQSLTDEEVHNNNEKIMKLNHELDNLNNSLIQLNDKYKDQIEEFKKSFTAATEIINNSINKEQLEYNKCLSLVSTNNNKPYNKLN